MKHLTMLATGWSRRVQGALDEANKMIRNLGAENIVSMQVISKNDPEQYSVVVTCSGETPDEEKTE